MYDIKLLNKISQNGLSLLPSLKYNCSEDAAEPHGILVRSAKMHDMPFGDNLLAIARAGAGVNNIPLEKCIKNGIVVFNTPGANANAVKELVVLGIMLSARKVFEGMQWVQTLKGQGGEVPALVEKGKSDFAGPEIKGKKLGIIGLGAIGAMVSSAAAELGMEIFGYDPFLAVDSALKISAGITRSTSIREVFEQCDYITLHLPSLDDTKGMINAQTIAMMKKGVCILNFARGNLVVNQDIIEALDEGQVRRYLTDFPEDELLGHPGVLAIPHLGASTPESEENCAIMAVGQLREYLEYGNIVNAVNLPNICVPPSQQARICVIHKNKPGLINNVSSLINVNIGSLTNANKGDIGYTIIEISAPQAGLCDEIAKISDVIRVRGIG